MRGTWGSLAVVLSTWPMALSGQASVTGRVTDARTGRPIAAALVSIEGGAAARTDSVGIYRLTEVPSGPQFIRATYVGFAPARQQVTMPSRGNLTVNLQLARNALEMSEITVTADPASRARGELGTASVIESEAIRNQMASSLAGVLELLPGVALQAPGLDRTQQIALRAVPVSGGGIGLSSATAAGPSATQLAAFGTQVVVDGVPLSNNANLQSLGGRSELSLPSAAGGGIDLRRIPAATIERVEVVRGIPSARYGDLTQGVIVVDTRAGAFEPLLTARFDANSKEIAFVGGRTIGSRHTASVTSNFNRTVVEPGVFDDRTYRLTTGVAHRFDAGMANDPTAPNSPRATFDTRIDFFRVFEDNPGHEPAPDFASFTHDAGLRALERVRIGLTQDTRLNVTAAIEGVSQESFTQGPRLRGAMPFTDRLTPGRSIGKYVGGSYVAKVNVSGQPRHLYTRTELTHSRTMLGSDHDLRAGAELRREWTGGAGYQFDVEFPPQSEFNGVQGFDRPRRYDAVPPVATTAIYLDDWIRRNLWGSATAQLQAGVRMEALHREATWFSGARDAIVQPRLNAEVAPAQWIRIRGGVGRMAKLPSFAALYPAPQYNDVVNVNWYANDPAERLAVLTTFEFDPTNPDLGYSYADRAEGGIEMELGRPDARLSVTVYADRLQRGVGVRAEPTFLLREHYQLSDSTTGTGVPPQIIEPPSFSDTVPVIIDRPANNLTVRASGAEATLTLPEIPWIRTRVAMQGSLARSRLSHDGVEFAFGFADFQLDENTARAPYWFGTERTGELGLVTTRLIHHQPALGLVISATIQHTLRRNRRDVGGADTLSWAGYITRAGVLVPVAESQRTDPQYQDLRVARTGLLLQGQKGATDWMFNLHVSKSLPGNGRLSFYAFNASDKVGRYGTATISSQLYAPTRFGLELSMPFPWLASQ